MGVILVLKCYKIFSPSFEASYRHHSVLDLKPGASVGQKEGRHRKPEGLFLLAIEEEGVLVLEVVRLPRRTPLLVPPHRYSPPPTRLLEVKKA